MANHDPISRRPAQETAKRNKKPSVRVVIQPVDSHRFRYKSEGRWAGSIPGVNNEGNKEGFPTIEITGCPKDKAVIVVSCVTKESPYKTHPHGVVARELYMSEEEVKKGACKMEVELTGKSTRVSFRNIGIHSCKHNQVKEVLKLRRLFNVDPFGSGFDYGGDMKSIDLNALRLCFQVFIMDDQNRVRLKLAPVVTSIIHDKKTQGELHIVRLSHDNGPATGGTPVILLCKKVKPSDTTVVFVERDGGGAASAWETAACNLSVHQNSAFYFNTPPFRDTNITTQVTVWVQLKRLSDNARSDPVMFQYTPTNRDSQEKERMHKKPLLVRLQNGVRVENVPMEFDMSHERGGYNPAQTPLKRQPSPEEQKPLQLWPTDLPPMVGPSSYQQYPAQDISWMDRSYVQLEQQWQLVPSQHAPAHMSQATVDYSAQPFPPETNLNPFTCHQEYDMYADNRSERHTVSPLFAPSPDLNRGQEEMQISLEKFSGILEEQISDHLSELSLKDFVGGELPMI